MAGAMPVTVTTDVPIVGRAAVPCYVDESLPMEGGPARAVVIVTDGPMVGGPARAVRLTSGGPVVGPALPIYIVSGILDVLAYASKVKSTAAANLLAYWPLAESSGTVITDESGNGRNGAYSNVTLGAAGTGDGRSAATFNGTTSYGNVYSASLAGAFNGQEGTAALWAQVSGAGVWADGVQRWALALSDSAGNNRVVLNKQAGANTLALIYTAGGVAKSRTAGSQTQLGWFHFAATWSLSGDALKLYINGVQSGATVTGLGTFVGPIVSTKAVIGAADTTPATLWGGALAHVGIWNTPLSAAQIAQLATVP